MKLKRFFVLIVIVYGTVSCADSAARRLHESKSMPPSYISSGNNSSIADPIQAKQASGHELTYEPAVVELAGKLTVKQFYGPPNFGEHPESDSKEQAWILVLDKPVDVIGKEDGKDDFDSNTERNVSEVQLVTRQKPDGLLGKSVRVKGTLFHANTGHHHTAVLMQAESIFGF